jgi:hypothetical protein
MHYEQQRRLTRRSTTNVGLIMNTIIRHILLAALLGFAFAGGPALNAWPQTEPLPSWTEGVVKKSIDVALDAASVNKWTVVDMKRDWNVIFPFEKM